VGRPQGYSYFLFKTSRKLKSLTIFIFRKRFRESRYWGSDKEEVVQRDLGILYNSGQDVKECKKFSPIL